MSNLSRAVGAVKLALKAKAPTIMVGVGITAMVGGAVSASTQTLKVDEVLNPHVAKLEKIQRAQDIGREDDTVTYTDKMAWNDRSRVYSRAAFDLTRLYAVPTLLLGGGAALIISGHRVMVKRNATLAIAFTGLKSAFDKYRQNVRDEFGSEVDQAMAHGYVMREIIDPETGKVEIIRERDWEASKNDPYNRVFDQASSSQWHDDLGVNKVFVANQQHFAQQMLNIRGYLYLSEVYESLGFPETDTSRVVGWKVKRLPDGSKDIPMVDFGLNKPHPDDFKYNNANEIYLDFNVQGLIIGGEIQKLLEKQA